MNPNDQILTRQVHRSLLVLAGIAILSVSPVLAQMNGAVGQQPASPSQQSQQTQQSMSGMNQTATQDPNGSTQQMMDKTFVKNALQGGMAEVQLGQLALQKSSNDDVKQFAQRMVDDHTKLGDQMKQVARQMSVKIPDAPSGKDKSTMAKLQALNGDAFDKAYIKDMVKDHEKDQKEFKQEAANATNPALKQVATQGEQVISEHLQMVQQIAQKDDAMASK
jgi:putative membrane protein